MCESSEEKQNTKASSSYDLQVLQVANVGRDELKVVVAQVEGTQRLHHEEVAGQLVLVQVVVGQVEDLQHGKGAESAGQRVQTIDRHVQDAKLRHRGDGHGQLLQVVVAQIQNLQVNEVGEASGQLVDPVVAQRQSRDEGHAHWKERVFVIEGGIGGQDQGFSKTDVSPPTFSIYVHIWAIAASTHLNSDIPQAH